MRISLFLRHCEIEIERDKMAEKKLVKKFKAQFFEAAPSPQAIGLIIDVNGKGPYKAGRVLLNNIKSRYGEMGCYDKLTDANILCKFSDIDMATAAEDAAKEALFSRGICANSIKDSSNLITDEGNNNQYAVYLTTLRKNLFKCPRYGCCAIGPKKKIAAHIKTHDFVSKFNMLKKAYQGAGGDEKLFTYVEPIPYFHRYWKSLSCEFCDEKKFKKGNKLREHRKTCDKNPQPRFVCRFPGCEHVSNGKIKYRRHKNMHSGHSTRVIRDDPFKCDLCFATFPEKHRLTKHRKICKKLGSAKPVIPCDKCPATFSRPDSLVRHKKKNRCPGEKKAAMSENEA